jgi:hypothetical protein
MAKRLEDLLRDCTVQVLGGPMSGAGFFIAPGKVLTCFHVIGDSQALSVRWERDGRQPVDLPVVERELVLADRGLVIPALAAEYPDIAVLGIAAPDDQPCVGIDTEWPSHADTFQAFGYPQEGGVVQLTAVRLTYRGPKGHHPTLYLDLASDTIKPGMSGAAVLNLRSGAVCGVVVASKHAAHPDGALAIPWSAIDTDLCQVLAANKAFQLRDPRWNTAMAADRTAEETASGARTPILSASPRTGHAIAEPAPPVVPGIPAYRLPTQWRPDGGPCPVSDAYLADLGAWLCLDRGASTHVVATRSGTRLADALNVVEHGPIKHGQALAPELPERTWHAVDANADEHELRSLQANGRVPALMVSWPVGIYTAGPRPGRPASRAYERIRGALPSAPVVFLVQAEHAMDALAAAAEIGRDLRAIRRGSPIDVLTQMRPGEPELSPPGPGPHDEPDRVAHRLVASVAAQLRARALPVPPYAADGAPPHADADPARVAAQVIEALELTAPWGPPAAEALALGLVRDHAPRYFLDLIGQHAVHRSGPSRWASLYAAADFDDYVDAWLDAAPEVGVPTQVPRPLRDGRLIAAVLLGLLRRGEAGIGQWRDAARHRSDAAWRVACQAANGTVDASFFQNASAETGLAAIRAAVGNPLHADLRAPEASAAWWAAVGRSPLTERTVATLAAMSDQARRVAGFTTDRDEPDPAVAELMEQMRTAMRPPLPRWRNDI